jgi:hypothetical protein
LIIHLIVTGKSFGCLCIVDLIFISRMQHGQSKSIVASLGSLFSRYCVWIIKYVPYFHAILLVLYSSVAVIHIWMAGLYPTFMETTLRCWSASRWHRWIWSSPLLQLPQWELLWIPGLCNRIPLTSCKDILGTQIWEFYGLFKGWSDQGRSHCS